VSTFGHPEWARTHEPASSTAPAVSALVEGGATCVATTVLDDLALGFVLFSSFLSISIQLFPLLLFPHLFIYLFIFSIGGENKHYGTPTNPAVPARVPGGSSSGAAVAVAADFVDFALGQPPSSFITLKTFFITI